MLSPEEQKQLDRNIQREGMLRALGKIGAIVRRAESEEQAKARAVKVFMGVLAAIGIVTIVFAFFGARHEKTHPALQVASESFLKYGNDWTRQVQNELIQRCFNISEAGNQIAGAVLTTSIKKDGTVEEVTVTRSSGTRELDEIAVQGILSAAPFAPFPPEILRDADVLNITRTFRRVTCAQESTSNTARRPSFTDRGVGGGMVP